MSATSKKTPLTANVGSSRWLGWTFQAAVAALAFVAGWHFAPSPRLLDKNTTPPQGRPPIRSTASKSISVKPPATAAEAAATLMQLFKARKTHEALEYITALDGDMVKNLVDDFKNKPVFAANTWSLRNLMARLTEVDPQAARDRLKDLQGKDGYASISGAVFDILSRQDPPLALAALADLKGSKSTLINTILSNYVQKDPAAALAALRSLPVSVQSNTLYANLFKLWANQDPAAASASAIDLPISPFRNQALKGITEALAARDAPTALAATDAIPEGQNHDAAVASVLKAVSSHAPAEAAAYAAELPEGTERDALLNSVTAQWAQQDPATLLSWAGKNLAGATYDSAVRSALSQMAASNPVAAAAYLAQHPDSNIDSQILSTLANNWGNQDHAAALAWAQSLPLDKPERNMVISSALNSMISSKPADAAIYIQQNMAADPAYSTLATQVAASWGTSNPQAALAWAQSLPLDNSDRNMVISSALNSMISSKPADAATYIQQNMATDPAYSTLVAQIATSWGTSNPQAALAWVQNLPSGDIQNHALISVVTKLASVDPQAAWNYAIQFQGDSKESLQSMIISNWADKQPGQAAVALQSLAQGDNLNSTVANVAKSWLAQDPNAASEWINTLPSSPARDAAVNQLIVTIGKNDPAGAFNWAVSLDDATTRNTQVVKLATQWSSSNPTAAAAAVQNALGNLTNLTIAQRASLQKIINNKAVTP